jgi:uncharacterized protein (TIGR03083 family)
MTLSLGRRLDLVDEQSAALQAAAARVSLAARVPSCPDWSVRQLLEHHGRVLRGWASEIDAANPSAPQPWMEHSAVDPPWPPMGADWQAWYAGGRTALRDAVLAAGEDGPAWTWWGQPATAGAIARHQVQEACVHRWDAQVAAGLVPDPLPGEAAADGLAEIHTVAMRAEPPPWSGPDLSVALVPVDAAGWLVTGTAGIVSGRPLAGHPSAGTAAIVRGTASDLVLMLYGRLPVGDLQVEGDLDAAVRLLV